ncbi:MAG: galactose oxidase, partial [Chitinophagaceae bacterium]|nr:galactose oxidase [Chitinophagaceae bacterium]
MNTVIKTKKNISRSFIIIYILASAVFCKADAQAYGLIFSSHEVVPEKRTSLDLTGSNPICFSGALDLSFELSFVPNYSVYFGYIFRLVNAQGQNIDLIYDQKKAAFRVVFGETFTDISFAINDNILTGEWNKIRFIIDENKGITCYINNLTWKSKKLDLKSTCFKLLFGAVNEHKFITRDVPPMKLKNIKVHTGGKDQHYWPLDESAGDLAEDHISHVRAKIGNPAWIKPQHANWEHVASISIKGRPSLAFNPDEENLYLVGTDSLYTFSGKNVKLSGLPLSVPHSNMIAGNQSVFNPYNKGLYNFFIDQKAVAEYDFTKKRWNRNFEATPVTEFWQANKFFSRDSSLFIIGGYGQLKYKNTVQKYSLVTRKWDTLNPQGDFLAPRYLAGLGTTGSGEIAYILGGYGSKEGDQLLSPNYFYDLLQYDTRQNRFKKIYSLPEPDQQFVFANSLVIDSNANSYYALIFPNDRFNNNLQLIKGSLSRPEYSLLGKPFPYSFNDVRSFADLYYCKVNKLLLAATMYTSKDDITEVKIYSIHFPPNEIIASGLPGTANEGKSFFTQPYTLLISGLVLLAILYTLAKKYGRRKRTQLPAVEALQPNIDPGLPKPVYTGNTTESATGLVMQEASMETPDSPAIEADTNPGVEDTALTTEKSRIILFGDFEVITADRHNITRQFTPLLKEMFLLILIDSLRYKKGVSSEKLNDILWNNKNIKDAKNNRSVNLVKLKNILDKLGGCTISRETGAWKFEYDLSRVHIDLLDYLTIFTPHEAVPASMEADKLASILKGGTFLRETHYEWLDGIKAEISNFVIDLLLKHSET